ncbi:AMP-binding protein [Chitinophaga pendula]|nr:condensation domain-containing protein [Chitinophaga pendula]UCJ09085.1 AMP-binding protein [Chitinophaga pendula]
MIKELLYTVFEATANEYPSLIAIEEDNEQCSYERLNTEINDLCRYLEVLQLKTGEVVGVALHAGIRSIASLLACFKRGQVYMPVSFDLPDKQLSHIFEQTHPSVLIVNAEQVERITSFFHSSGIYAPYLISIAATAILNELHLDDLAGITMEASGWTCWKWNGDSYVSIPQEDILLREPPQYPEIDKQDNAYIYYTSGSTGLNKGIIGTHNSLAHYIHWHRNAFEIKPGDRISQLAPLTFDASLKDILVALTAGATLCVPAKSVRQHTDQLSEWLFNKNITILQTVPSLFRVLMKSLKESGKDLPALRHIALAGERLYGQDVLNWKHINGDKCLLSNLYGLTETTILKSRYLITHSDWLPGDIIPVGQPISNTSIAVINYDQICAPGEIGDIYIKSPFVTKGYIDKQLNEQLFVQNPVVKDKADIVCRTGDIGRYRSDGNLELLGRKDDQVKFNGIRIELDMVKSALLNVQGIDQVEILLITVEDLQQSLVCYYTGEETNGTTLVEILRRALPVSHIPGYYVWLKEFPLNVNGKVDRKQLPKLATMLVLGEEQHPRPGDEQTIAGIWQQILGIEQISRSASFFTLGGSSLKAIQLISKIYKQLDTQLTIVDIFNHATIEAQAKLLQRSDKSDFVPIPTIAVQDRYPLSHAQQRIWVLEERIKGQPTFNMFMSYRLIGHIVPTAIETAINKVIARHESLRTSFFMEEGIAWQRIQDNINFYITQLDFCGRADVKHLISAEIEKAALHPFELQQAPLLRIVLLKLDIQEYLLLYCMHHIIADEWSLQIFMREVVQLYNAAVLERTIQLPALTIQYKDFTHWQQEELSGERLLAHRNYWLQKLSGEIPVLKLPGEKKRPDIQTYSGAQYPFDIDNVLYDKWKTLLHEQQVTPFMGLTALVKALLFRYSGQEDIIIGTPVAGREHPDLEYQIGYYLNTLALRDKIDKQASFLALLQQVKTTALEAFEHQVYPFDRLVEELGVSRDMSRSPLFDVVVVFQNIQVAASDLPRMHDLEIYPEGIDAGISKGDIRFEFEETADGLLCGIEFNTDLYDLERIKKMSGHFISLMTDVLKNPDHPLHGLNYLTPAEISVKKEQLSAFNATMEKGF